ncbi:MAG: alkaline phosphatase family protein [Candidatus Krumholzibacteriia bacterium]
MKKTLLIFIDGLGWGPADSVTNPCHAYGGQCFRFPDPAPDGPVPVFRSGWARPIDAVLGVDGVPQSATGQTTLLTGVNAQAALGRHLTGFPNAALRAILLEHSILKILAGRGYRARFLNAFRPLFWKLSREQQLTLSATTVANLAAGLPFFDLEDVKAGRSIYQEFTNRELQERGFDVPVFTPEEAGRVLARNARLHDFTFFEYFQSDKAGHSRDHVRIGGELAKLDAFLEAVLGELETDLAGDLLVVLTSDHGNLEDTRKHSHTTNPVPLMAWGCGSRDFVTGIEGLDQVTPAILQRHP